MLLVKNNAHYVQLNKNKHQLTWQITLVKKIWLLLLYLRRANILFYIILNSTFDNSTSLFVTCNNNI